MKNLIFTLILLGFLGCKKDDPCDNVTCLNGGTCANGDCNCPDRYTGSDCSQQKTPERIGIDAITITDFDAVDGSGASWDFGSGAELFVILAEGTQTIWNSRNDQYYPDAVPGIQYSFYPPVNIVLDNPTSVYTLYIYDMDDGVISEDDFIGGINFNPYSSNNGFPNELTFDDSNCTNCNFEFQIEINYQF